MRCEHLGVSLHRSCTIHYQAWQTSPPRGRLGSALKKKKGSNLRWHLEVYLTPLNNGFGVTRRNKNRRGECVGFSSMLSTYGCISGVPFRRVHEVAVICLRAAAVLAGWPSFVRPWYGPSSLRVWLDRVVVAGLAPFRSGRLTFITIPSLGRARRTSVRRELAARRMSLSLLLFRFNKPPRKRMIRTLVRFPRGFRFTIASETRVGGVVA